MATSIARNARVKVSSVLNRDVKQFGKQYLFDKKVDTCWNSDQGSPQWIHIQLDEPASVEEVQIRFQGGFVGENCVLEGCSEPGQECSRLMDIFPEDNNSLQIFRLKTSPRLSSIKIVFSSSTDFYGRITIYDLDILGHR